MDEALAQAAIDVGGRAFYEGRIPSPLYQHFLQSFAMNLGATLHVRILRGKDRHHMVEAAIKAVGLSLRQALRTGDQVFSTKGAVALSVPAGKAARPGKAAKAAAKGAAREAKATKAAKGAAKVRSQAAKTKRTSDKGR
jgi:hypothetical protein